MIAISKAFKKQGRIVNINRSLDYNATLIQRIDLTDKLAIFRVRPDANWGFAGVGNIPNFQPGQFAMLGMNNIALPGMGPVRRAYSIASPPEEKRWLEFYIRYVDNPASVNPLTHLLWKLKAGNRLHLGERIAGRFTLAWNLPPGDKRLIILVAAGTGVAPFHSLTASINRSGGDTQRFAVLHGASFVSDLGYRAEFQSIFKRYPWLYMPSISRPWANDGWSGATGRIESHFEDEHKLAALEQKLGLSAGGLNPERAVIFICGLTGTIRNIVFAMLKRGFVPNDRRLRRALNLTDSAPSLFYEQYDSEPVIDIHDPAVLAGAERQVCLSRLGVRAAG